MRIANEGKRSAQLKNRHWIIADRHAWRRRNLADTRPKPMKLTTDLRLPLPRETVFAAYRDAITRVLEFLPNVRSVEVKWRKEDEAAVHLVHEWHGGGQVPAAVRGIITESMLVWTDYATWDPKSFCCDWKIESHKFPEAVRCRGRNSFVDEGGEATLLEIRGTVEVDARRFPGVPSFLAKPVGRSVEEFLASTFESNVRQTIQWFEKYRANLFVADAKPAVGPAHDGQFGTAVADGSVDR